MARILHLSNSPYASLQAAGPSLAIFRELARDCDAYHVLAPADGPPRNERDGSLFLHTLPGRRSKAFAVTSLAAAGFVRRHHIDAIVVQDPLLGGVAAIHVGRAMRVPVMLEVHTDRWFDFAGSGMANERLLGRLAMRALRWASLVRTSGPRLTARLRDHGVDPERLRFAPYRVDTDYFAPAREAAQMDRTTPLAVSVGRFVPQKGYLELLDAIVTVPDLRLVLAGGGPLEEQLNSRICELGLAERVHLRGWISREQQRELLRAADLYLQPSVPNLGEWMPRTILEAMAVGLPVVATDVGGIGDVIVDREVGLLVAASAPAQLSAAMLRLAADDRLRSELGARARERALQQFSWDRSFDRYRATLSELAVAPPPNQPSYGRKSRWKR